MIRYIITYNFSFKVKSQKEIPMIPPRINCKKCLHYYVTWDVKFPNGCKLFGIKSKNDPYLIVFQSLAKPCENYQPKAPR